MNQKWKWAIGGTLLTVLLVLWTVRKFSSNPSPPLPITDIWVLSLPSEDRGLHVMRENLSKYGIDLSKASPFPGIDGRTLPLETVQTFQESVQNAGKGVLGCYLSHVAMWERAAKLPEESRILILEDDAQLVRNVNKIPQECAPYDYIYLGHVETLGDKIFPGFQKSIQPVCTHAYIVSPEGARKLLRSHTKADAIDIEIIRMIQSGQINAVSCFPNRPFAIQKDIKSSIGVVSGCKGTWAHGKCYE